MLYKKMIRPTLFKFDPEDIHHIITIIGKCAQKVPFALDLTRGICSPKNSFPTKVFGKTFSHPIGLAAGFDKNVELIPFLHALGFSFIEIGSVTNLPSLGNSKPRLFRLIPDESIINRMGLNNDGAEMIAPRLKERSSTCPIGVNIAKTHSAAIIGDAGIRDVVDCFKKMHTLGDYAAINISCPNTAEGKTFEEVSILKELLCEIKKVNSTTPTLLKLSPDLDTKNFDAILELSLSYKLAGVILGNTTQTRDGLTASKTRITTIGKGGLSGPLLFDRANNQVIHTRKIMPKEFVIIGVGGINSTERAQTLLDSGANLLQIYTSFIFEGPWFLRDVISRLR